MGANMSNYDTTQFQKDLSALSIHLTEHQIKQFIRYYEMLVEWNGFMNLTGITEYEEVMKKHFIDSLSLIKVYDLSSECNMIDVGTGAGFPGLALKIAFPNLQVTLLDSLNKRIQFLDAVIAELKLEGVNTVHGRAEDYARPDKLREQFDLCVSRAVANLTSLSEYCIPFIKVGGCFVAFKSEKVTEEIEASKNAVSILGGKIVKNEEFVLPDSNIQRNLILMKKVKNTPKKYPRKAGLPTKELLK